MRLSLIGMARPDAPVTLPVLPIADRSLLPEPGSERAEHLLQPALHLVRRLPFGRSNIPNRTSPRIIGSTTIRARRLSHPTTAWSGAPVVGSLSTLASTRNVTEYRWTRIQSRQRSLFPGTPAASPRRLHSPGRCGASGCRHVRDVPPRTLQTRLNAVLLPQFGGKSRSDPSRKQLSSWIG